jgi:hypothetical protein
MERKAGFSPKHGIYHCHIARLHIPEENNLETYNKV